MNSGSSSCFVVEGNKPERAAEQVCADRRFAPDGSRLAGLVATSVSGKLLGRNGIG